METLEKEQKPNKLTVKVHSAVTQMTQVIDIVPQKAWYYMLYKAFWNLQDHTEYSISVQQLASYLEGKETRKYSYTYLKDFLDKLLTHKVEFNILGKDKHTNWTSSTLLSEYRVEDGIITYSYSNFLRRELQNPKLFAKINLHIQRNFKGRYAFSLYNIFIDYLMLNQDKTEKIIEVDQLKKLLGFNDKQYVEFKTFNRDVIKRAVDEINEKSNIDVEYSSIRKNKSIIAIKFIIKKKDNSLPLVSDNQEQLLELLENIDKPRKLRKGKKASDKKDILKFTDPELTRSFEKLNITSLEKQIERLIEIKDELGKEHYEPYLVYLAKEVKREIKIRDINNPAGLFVDFLKQESFLKKYFQQLEQEKMAQTELQNRVNEKYLKIIKQVYDIESSRVLVSLIEGSKTNIETFINFLVQYKDEIELKEDHGKLIAFQTAVKKNNGELNIGLIKNSALRSLIEPELIRLFDFSYKPFEKWVNEFEANPDNQAQVQEFKEKAQDEALKEM